MKIEIGITNGGKWFLGLGNSRFAEYHSLGDLLKDLEKILNLYGKNNA